MDTKNVIAAISLSAAVIILYSLFFAPAVVDQKDISNDKNISSENSSTDAPSLAQDEETIKISRNEALKENDRIFFENEKIKGSISLIGSSIDDLTFKNYTNTLNGDVADFGSGWGFLSAQILKRKLIGSLDLIEADANALEISKLNIKDARANFYWNDATSWSGSYDTVVMNPPFHSGRSGDPDLGRAFIINSARNLRPKGDLWMVANRHLPYEKTLNQCFENVFEILGNSTFKLFQASRPKRN